MNKNLRRKLIPFSLSLFIILVDQITKLLVVANIPYPGIGKVFLGGFFRIIHTRNLYIAFSLGNGLSELPRIFLFIVLPLILIGLVVWYYFKTNEFTRLQQWAIAGAVGGGLGNQVDRIFRPLGVVDFLDFKFYNIFGWERFPTFNVADMTIVVFGALLFLTFMLTGDQENSGKDVSNEENVKHE